MESKRAPNDLGAAVPKFCLGVEEFRRTPDGRVRTPLEFLQHFFPHDPSKVTDRLFKFLPNEVRGPVLTSWGLRGAKSALKDTDEKVQSVVWDALLAGDIDHEAFEQAVMSETLIRWVPLSDWWAFWRGGKLTKAALHKALDVGYELQLFDAKWFFDSIEGPGGKLRGTDVVSEGLTKAELTEWVRKVHASGDGSPKGLLTAIGWDRVVAKTPNDVLTRVLDALASKVGLMQSPMAKTAPENVIPEERPSTRMTPVPLAGSSGEEITAMNALIRPAVSVAPAAAGAPPPPPAPNAGTKGAGGESSDEMVDRLFSESKIPPAEDNDQILVVEEEMAVETAQPEESPTNRPPASAEEPMLLKPRTAGGPPSGPTPAARRR